MADENETTRKTARQMTTAEVLKALEIKIPARHIGIRKQGGRDIPYLKWMIAAMYFNLYVGDWSKEVKNITQFGDKVAVTVRVTIHTKDGDIWREATAQEDDNKDDYGDTMTNAEASALKRAFANFGFGAELYLDAENVVRRVFAERNGGQNQQIGNGNPPSQQRTNASNNTGNRSNTPSEKQLETFRSLCEQKGQDMVDMSLQVSDDAIDDYSRLSGKQISEAIGQLIKMPKV